MTALDALAHAAIDIDGRGVATLAIRDAGALNILSTPVLHDLVAAFDRLRAMPEVKVVVLRGSGDRAFVAGADIKEMSRLDAASAPASSTCCAGPAKRRGSFLRR